VCRKFVGEKCGIFGKEKIRRIGPKGKRRKKKKKGEEKAHEPLRSIHRASPRVKAPKRGWFEKGGSRKKRARGKIPEG